MGRLNIMGRIYNEEQERNLAMRIYLNPKEAEELKSILQLCDISLYLGNNDFIKQIINRIELCEQLKKGKETNQ